MVKKLFTFIKHDFVSQVFSFNIMLTIVYSWFVFEDMSQLTRALMVLALMFAGFSVHRLYSSKVTVRYELILLLPLGIFTICLLLGMLNKYNEVNSFAELMTYNTLSRLIDFGLGASLFYGSFLALLGLSCSIAANESFDIPSNNIEKITGHQPDFVHYRITKSHKTLLTLNNFTFSGQGLVRNNSVIGYHDLYNYLKEQNMRFNALTDDDFLTISMVKI